MKVEIYRTVIFVLLPQIRAVDIEVSTADNRKYVKLSTHCIVAAGRSFYTFQVKAKNDAHIALMSEDDDARPLYEIVIGGWGNKKSCIRTGKQLPCLSTYQQTVLSQTAYRLFWVSWIGGYIVVGEGDVVNKNVFMSYHHSNPYHVNFFAVMTGWSSSGQWKFSNDVRCTLQAFNNTRIVENYTDCVGTTTYECDSGYFLHSGNLQRTCFSNRTWSGEPPYCKQISCPQISSTVSYAIQHQDTDIGGNVTAVCSDNFRHSSGHLTRECTSNGSWDGEEPVCLRCRCPCSLIGQQGFNSSSELEQRLKQLKRELEIAKNSTSSFYRKRNCALDNRLSSASLGYLCGYGVIISIAVYLVIPDLSILYRHFRFGAD
ncbi:uncharacterized protein LOC133173312 isoform X1 [Saccostrea echinata]|uniref:uncharacterized protein LOC133173312 isoform X1 n=1 Tax=Saccostrea echinata TaxID=191078 RepID=UPI002A802715|nr:uncharacterized protein LOC133173312 isoform X1 [Saccostrea echinata]